MKSGSLAAGEDMAGTNFVFIVEDQLPPERNELFDAQRREQFRREREGCCNRRNCLVLL